MTFWRRRTPGTLEVNAEFLRITLNALLGSLQQVERERDLWRNQWIDDCGPDRIQLDGVKDSIRK